jgi:hypothetical protein
MIGASGVYNVRPRYNSCPVRGDMDVADSELDRQVPPPESTPGFVVGHHPATSTAYEFVAAHVTVDVNRQLRRYLTPTQAHDLGMALVWAADLARLEAA